MKQQLQGKYELELNLSGDSIFLNYWDWMHGIDVCCRVVDGKLMNMHDEEEKEISFSQFIEMVKETISKRNQTEK